MYCFPLLLRLPSSNYFLASVLLWPPNRCYLPKRGGIALAGPVYEQPSSMPSLSPFTASLQWQSPKNIFYLLVGFRERLFIDKVRYYLGCSSSSGSRTSYLAIFYRFGSILLIGCLHFINFSISHSNPDCWHYLFFFFFFFFLLKLANIKPRHFSIIIIKRLDGEGIVIDRNWNLTILPNITWTNRNLFKKIRHKILWDFQIQIDHLIPVRRPDLKITNKEKRTWRIVDFAVPVERWAKIKENETRNKYLDLAWTNMKVTVIAIIIGALGTISKGLERGVEELEIGGRAETIQTTALLRSTKILRLEETCCHLDSSERVSVNAGVKNSQGVKIIKGF